MEKKMSKPAKKEEVSKAIKQEKCRNMNKKLMPKPKVEKLKRVHID